MTPTLGGCSEVDAVFTPFDPVQAVDFIERRACDLRHALARPDDPAAVESLKAHQAASHEGWLNLIHSLADGDTAVLVDQIATLYGFHGRVAACLERGLDPRLGPQVAVRVRVQLMTELQQRTSAATAALLAQPPAAAPA